MSTEDARELGVREGDRVRVESDTGAEMECGVHIAAIKPRNVQAFWPECNVLLRRRVCDVAAGIPDYNATVRITPIRVGEQIAAGASIAAQ
jgi:anaerobic selenocysteine-containing dehydrogenase